MKTGIFAPMMAQVTIGVRRVLLVSRIGMASATLSRVARRPQCVVLSGHIDSGHLLRPNGPLAHGIPSYEHRPGQIRMARAVQDVLHHDGVLLIEAGTGTGKTWAYLIPAALERAPRAGVDRHAARVDQIMEKDLPALKSHLGIDINAACVKGLSNYLCRRRFQELPNSADATQPRFARPLPRTSQLDLTRPIAAIAPTFASGICRGRPGGRPW